MAVNGILGIKLGMAQVFAEDGAAVGCTVLQAGPCVVVQRRTKEKDGYDAAQLGLVEFIKPQRVTKPMTGHFKKAEVAPMRRARGSAARRLRGRNQGRRPRSGGPLSSPANLWTLPASARARALRAASSAGTTAAATRRTARCSTARRAALARVRFLRASGPASIFPGTWAIAQVTIKNLRVVKVDADENLLLVYGSVPGPAGTYILIRKARKSKAASAKSRT